MLVSWITKKQSLTCRSFVEAECRALAYTSCEAIWLKYVLADLNFPISDTILLVFHALQIDCHFIREKIQYEFALYVTEFQLLFRQFFLRKIMPIFYLFFFFQTRTYFFSSVLNLGARAIPDDSHYDNNANVAVDACQNVLQYKVAKLQTQVLCVLAMKNIENSYMLEGWLMSVMHIMQNTSCSFHLQPNRDQLVRYSFYVLLKLTSINNFLNF